MILRPLFEAFLFLLLAFRSLPVLQRFQPPQTIPPLLSVPSLPCAVGPLTRTRTTQTTTFISRPKNVTAAGYKSSTPTRTRMAKSENANHLSAASFPSTKCSVISGATHAAGRVTAIAWQGKISMSGVAIIACTHWMGASLSFGRRLPRKM